MPARRLMVFLAALALLVAACGDDGDGAIEEDLDTDPDAGEEDLEEDLEENLEDLDEEDLEDLGLGEPEPPADPVDLPDGLAATVDDEEIDTDTVDERFDNVASVPEVEEQLEGEGGDMVAEQLQAQILTRLILDRIVTLGADDLGVEVSEEEIAEREAEEAEAAGGEDVFEDELAAQGITPEQLEEELRTIVLLDAIEEEITADLDDEDFEADEEMGLSEADLAVQEWLFEQLEERNVEVDEEYGVWDPQSAQVVPEGGMPQPELPEQ